MKRVGLVVGVLAVALAGALAVRQELANNGPPLVIVHWSNSHPMRENLLPNMAAEFNAADHETASGQDIEVEVVQCDSSVQAADLVGRVKGGGRSEHGCAGGEADDPTIVTPQSDDWLIDVNARAGRDVIDLTTTVNIAETWLGIVTYRSMAECLGYPDKELGYTDLLELRSHPDGWEKQGDCARFEWGRKPLLAFTNPSESTSGRNVLVSLYSIAAGKPPSQLTVDDVERPDVVNYVKEFQGLVDHYMPNTISLNTKIWQGQGYGHFFLMPEDNLVSLYKGNERMIAADGSEQSLPAVRDLVMIYPKEGSVLNSNPAALVDAPWVSEALAEAAGEWIDYLREDDQQRQFMVAGFRPAAGTSSELAVNEGFFQAWGLNPRPPQSIIEPGDLQPAVLDRIIESWGEVKNPAIVTFVVDVSGSMRGEPIALVQDGVTRLLQSMADNADRDSGNQVGLVTFSDTVQTEMPPAPIHDTKYDIAAAVFEMKADGETALFDAVQRAIQLTDDVAGDPRAKRSVVVLSDGEATAGRCLDSIVSMTATDESPVTQFCAIASDEPIDDQGRTLSREDVIGTALDVETQNDIQVFFLGFGEADLNIGRILAQATGAEYQGSTEADLTAVIAELSGYF